MPIKNAINADSIKTWDISKQGTPSTCNPMDTISSQLQHRVCQATMQATMIFIYGYQASTNFCV